MPTRRVFLANSALAGFGAAAPALAIQPDEAQRGGAGGVNGSFPRQELDAVREVVGKSHFDAERVAALLESRPELAKAAWDWGFGDWETALGAASHVGRADIAELLMDHGARPTLFTLAMLGRVDAVRAVCEAVPGVQRTHGPHGITLMQHARNGPDARLVVEYLAELGGADEGVADLGIEEADAEVYVGDYDPRPADPFVIRVGFDKRSGMLTLRRDEDASRKLHRLGAHKFSPAGAPSVRVGFSVDGARARSLVITDGARRFDAVRGG